MKPSSYNALTLLGVRLLAAFIFLLPVVWISAAALYPAGVPLPVSIWLLPDSPTMNNFSRLSEYFPMLRLGFNSLWISLLGVGITILTASLVAFAITRLSKGLQQRWVILMLAVLMIPEIALWSTRFLLYKGVGWLDTPLALIAPAFIGSSPFFILMYYRAFRRVPRDIYEYAHLDGAGLLKTWWSVALPIAFPTTIGIGLLSFVYYWGDFTSPMLYLTTQKYATLPLSLQSLQQLTRSDWSLLMAGTVSVLAVPVLLLVFLTPFFNRQTKNQRTTRVI